MDNLARNFAGLVLSDNLVIKAVAISEVAQMARAETRLREYLIAAWNRRQTKAITQATSMAKQLKPASSISAAISKHMDSWDQEILPAFLAEVEKTYKLAREAAWKKATRQTQASLSYPIPARPDVEPTEKAAVGVKTVARIRPSFDLADEQAVAALKRSQVLWIGKHYKRRVSPAIADVTRVTMAEAGRSAAVAGTLMAKRVADTLAHVKVPGGFYGSAPQYFEGLTANAMTVARVHGQVRSFMDIGITTYSISNPGDKRTCARCAHMDGKTFKTKQGGEQMQRELGAKDPDAVKAVHPWLSPSQIKSISPTGGPMSGKAGDADSKALADKGQALPPYHFKCRCTVDIGTDSMTYENLQPMTAPVPGKPIVPKIPIGLVRAPNVTAWAKGLKGQEKKALSVWTGGVYPYIRSADAGTSLILKEPKAFQKEASKWLKNLKSMLAKAPHYKGTAYRGLSSLEPIAAKAMIKPGNIISQDAISSWSKSNQIGESFARATPDKRFIILEMETKSGFHDVSTAVHYSAKHEQELLALKGKKAVVKSAVAVVNKHGEKGYRIILQEVDEAALPKLKPVVKPKPVPKPIPKPKISVEQEQLDAIRTGKLVESKKISTGVNGAYKVTLETKDGKQVKGVWKAAKDDSPSLRTGIKGGTYYKREAASYRLDGMLGGEPVVPPTIARELPRKGIGSVQMFEEKAVELNNKYFEWNAALSANSQPTIRSLRKMVLLDVISANDDRHVGNVMIKMVTKGKTKIPVAIAIDNGLTFPQRWSKQFLTPVQNVINEGSLLNFDASSIKQLKGLKLTKVAKMMHEEGISVQPIRSTLTRIKALQKNPKLVSKYFKEQKKTLDWYKQPISDGQARNNAVVGFWKDAVSHPSKMISYGDLNKIEDIIDALPK